MKTGTRSGGVSFGFVDVAEKAVLVHKRVRVFNRSKQPAIFKVKPTYRFANDVSNGAVKIHALPLIAVPGKGDRTIDVFMTIEGSKLRNNLMNAGPDGPNPVPLTLQEYDGYLVFEKVALFGKPEKFTLPWHVLPRKSASTDVTSGKTWKAGSGGIGTINLKNRGVGAAQLNGYSLLATSPNTPPGGRGENAPRPDLRAVGVTTFEVPTDVCSSGYLWSFAVNMWERETLPVAVDHRIALDLEQRRRRRLLAAQSRRVVERPDRWPAARVVHQSRHGRRRRVLVRRASDQLEHHRVERVPRTVRPDVQPMWKHESWSASRCTPMTSTSAVPAMPSKA